MAIYPPIKKIFNWQLWNEKIAPSGGGYTSYKEVEITSAQLLALTPILSGSAVELLPSLGITKWYDFKIILEFKAGSAAYVGGSTYAISNATQSYRTIVSTTFTGTTAGDVKLIGPTFTAGSGIVTINDPGDTSVWFTCSGAAPTAGNGTLVAKIWYSEIPVG